LRARSAGWEDLLGMSDPSQLQARGHLAVDDPATADLAAGLGRELGDPRRDPGGFVLHAFELEPARWLRRMPGRETFAHGERIVLKRFRGDAWREWWHEFSHGTPPRSPARREGENLAALRELGLCVPAPLAWAEEPASIRAASRASRSALAMELLAHEEHLRQRLSRSTPEELRAWLEPLARVVAQLHGAHWFHRDLYLQHFAVLDARAHRLALLDCGRARHAEPVPRRWIVKDLAQLLHSAPANVGVRTRLRWLCLYARARGLPGVALRGLIAAVSAKQRRMAAHAPRHLDPRTANPDGSER